MTTPMPTSAILRAIAQGGYSPEMDTTGSTRDVLLALAAKLEQQATRSESAWDALVRRYL